jgi:hypothetical protein
MDAWIHRWAGGREESRKAGREGGRKASFKMYIVIFI